MHCDAGVDLAELLAPSCDDDSIAPLAGCSDRQLIHRVYLSPPLVAVPQVIAFADGCGLVR